MVLTLNGAGSTAADPILKGIPLKAVAGASSFDATGFTDFWIETTATIPGTAGSVKGSLSPTSSIFLAGIGNATYNDSTKIYSVPSTTDLSIGDRIYLSHGSLTPGFYEIATVGAGQFTLVAPNPLNGANQTGISYEAAWSYLGNTGAAPIASSPAGQINYAKVRLTDSIANNGDKADFFYVADQPAGSALIGIGGQGFTGGSVTTLTPTFTLLNAWASKGGISYVELANHSTQAVNNFQWGDLTITEKTLATALTSGFKLSAGDGIKYGRLLLKSKSGGTALGIDLSVSLDTTGPTVVLALVGA